MTKTRRKALPYPAQMLSANTTRVWAVSTLWIAIWVDTESEWTNRLFYHLLDMSVINSWIVYKKGFLEKNANPKNILKLVAFRTELAETLCKYGNTSENKRSRPSLNTTAEPVNKQRRPKLDAQTLPS